MAIQHTSFVLKVLNGINVGAVVRLKTGSLVIGRSMTSDIILHDENIADQHVQLLITPASVTLQPLARPVFVGGMEVTADSVDLAPYQTVRLGNVEFWVADSRVAAPQSASKSAAAVDPAPKRPSAGKSAPPPKQKPQSAHKAPAKEAWGGKTWLAIGLGLLLLANLIYWIPQFNTLAAKNRATGFGGATGGNPATKIGAAGFQVGQ